MLLVAYSLLLLFVRQLIIMYMTLSLCKSIYIDECVCVYVYIYIYVFAVCVLTVCDADDNPYCGFVCAVMLCMVVRWHLAMHKDRQQDILEDQ